MKTLLTILSLAALVLAPIAVDAQVTTEGLSACENIAGNGFSAIVDCLVGGMNTIIGLLMAAAVLYIVWGAFNMIRSEEKREEGKQVILHGVIGLFVMISIWGFVNILDSTFGGLSDEGPVTPNLIEVNAE